METTDEKERLTRVTIPVVGMTCASCVRQVERALSGKEGGCRVERQLRC